MQQDFALVDQGQRSRRKAPQETTEMPQDRVSELLAAYFNQPYDEYGEAVLEIRESGGLDSDEVRLIQSQVLLIDACTILRQSGTIEAKAQPAST